MTSKIKVFEDFWQSWVSASFKMILLWMKWKHINSQKLTFNFNLNWNESDMSMRLQHKTYTMWSHVCRHVIWCISDEWLFFQEQYWSIFLISISVDFDLREIISRLLVFENSWQSRFSASFKMISWQINWKHTDESKQQEVFNLRFFL